MLELSDIKVKDVLFTLFLTNKRLLLSEKGMKGEISSQIPLPVIVSANAGSSESGEPALTISIKAPDGSDRRMMFAFHDKPGAGDRSDERDTLLQVIEHGELPSRADRPRTGNNLYKGGDDFSRPGMNSINTNDPGGVQNSMSGSSFHQPPPPSPRFRDFQRRRGEMNFSSGIEEERNRSQWSAAGQIRTPPSDESFRQPPPPPPPPPERGDRTGSGNMDSYSNFGTPGHVNPHSYDHFPEERVAPQYTRRFERDDSRRPDRQPDSEFVYAPPSGRRQRTAPKRNGYGSRRSGGGYSDSDSFPGTIIGLIRSPEEMFRQVRSREVMDAVPVLLVSLAVFAFGSLFFLGMMASDASAYPYLSGLADMGTLIFVSVEMIIFGAICAALTGVLLHFVSYYEGFDEDIGQALKVAAYSAAPYAVGGLIPFLGIIIAPFWSIYLQYTGMRETYYMESDQASVAVLVPAAVFVVLFIIMTMLGADNFSIFG